MSGQFDTIRNQVMWDRLINVVEEQARTMMRVAFSPVVREAGDLSAGVFNPSGQLLAQAVTGTPGHINSMARSVRHFMEVIPPQTMCEGDSYITNDPWKGTGHLFDLTVVTPAFLAACRAEGRLLDEAPFALRDELCEAAFAKKHGLEARYTSRERESEKHN